MMLTPSPSRQYQGDTERELGSLVDQAKKIVAALERIADAIQKPRDTEKAVRTEPD